MRALFIIITSIHGLIHLMGFAKAYNLAELSQLTKPISKLNGILWLLCTLLFFIALLLFLVRNDEWWIIGAVAIILSQIVIIYSWTDAKFGTIANVIIFVPIIVSFMGALPSSFMNVYNTEVEKKLHNPSNIPILLEEDIQHLPNPVTKYLYYVGAVGKPIIINFKVISSGKMKFNIEANWMDINSQQYNFYNYPSRFFYIQSKIFGVPFDGLHIFNDNMATMQIKVASLVKVVDASGKEMNQSETVTFFNDLCLFAPAGLVDKAILWRSIDSLTVEATYSNKESTIKAMLYFNQKGELINFVSNYRYQSMDGKVYDNYKWSTPIKDYREFDGRKIPTYGEAIWHKPEGAFTYAIFNLKEIDFNTEGYK